MAKDGQMSKKAPALKIKSNVVSNPVKTKGDPRVKGGRPGHINQ